MAIIKLCGLRTYADALLVNEVQPDYAGFIFAFGKRQITVETACNLSKVIKGSRLVGVFVNEQPARIQSRSLWMSYSCTVRKPMRNYAY